MIRNSCITFLEGLLKNEDFRQQFIAYLAGAFSVCLFWFCKVLWHALQHIPDNLQHPKRQNNDNDDEEEEDDNFTWIDPWNAPLNATKGIMAAVSANIGELPIPFKKRQHWPWETIRRRFVSQADRNEAGDVNETNKMQPGKDMTKSTSGGVSESPIAKIDVIRRASSDGLQDFMSVDDDVDDLTVDSKAEIIDHEGKQGTENVDPKKQEKSFCIGSIFGLDVGGTLAKLVYFEQKSPEVNPLKMGLRERHYAQAASAQAVIMARLEEEATAAAAATASSPCGAKGDRDCNYSDASSDSNMSSSTPTATLTHQYHARRRSFSIGFMGRLKDLQNEHQKEQQNGHKSERDLKRLYALRQESLPDDIRQFRHSVDFHALEEEKLKEIYGPDGDHGEENDIDMPNLKVKLISSPSPIGRSKSMFDMSKHFQQKAEALDRFYDFARRLDSQPESIRDDKLSFYSRELGGEFHFIRFETRRMKNAMDLIRYNNLHLNIVEMGATGGGAHKYAEVWERELGIRMDKQDELDSLVAGMQFVLSTVIGECYTFRPVHNITDRTSSLSTTASPDTKDKEDQPPNDFHVGLELNDSKDMDSSSHSNRLNSSSADKVDEWWWSRKVQRDTISYSSSYPYLLVTIGTGVSVLRVDGPRRYERISGSTIGGGTYWGLMRLLTDVESFDNAMKLAEVGDPSKVDMMVGDIYGKNSDALEKLGLPANIVASSFGKLVAKEDPAEGLTQEDLARALLLLVTNNIGQVAYLNAKLCNTRRIYFVGSFLRQNTISQRRLSYAIDYWSKGEMEALFLEHEGYFGALGAFLKSQNIERRDDGFF